MGDPNLRREAVRLLEYMVKDCRPEVNCIVHDSDIPFPNYLKDFEFDLIILGPTFLCNRYCTRKLARVLSDYSFIKESTACKIALPQDDYDCSLILDDWMVKWGVNRVYSVCPKYWDLLYPKTSKLGQIKLGYTGYISNKWIDNWVSPKPFETRKIDVSYRASKLPANFGILGQLKSDIADRFCNSISSITHLNLDISVDLKDMIPGSKWHYFLENSKFCISTASGSSLHDPHGIIRSKVRSYVLDNPGVDFHEIESACFPEQDNHRIFTALSPRNIEAALAQTVQLATKGSYSELMKPYEHFIPLAEDCSNIPEVLEMMEDRPFISNVRNQCKEAILSEPRLRCHNFVNELISFAEDFLSFNHSGTRVNQDEIDKLFNKYNSWIEKTETIYWRRRRFKTGIRSLVYKLGGKPIFNLLFNFLPSRNS